jgi:7-cyano-7-deazaguanine tRNA-ribosyltransferase
MALSFEVRETDLLGRIGRLAVGGKRVETPYLFPVIHPVSQTLELDTLAAMGFSGVMTNSYILYKRRREEALSLGIHKLLGFDGMVMTDSGGYQVLEYGDLDATYAEIAAFQSGMGSDLAVTLDKPTGYSWSRKYSLGTMEKSLNDAVATLKEFSGSETTWVGPVQGGLFEDLLRTSARTMVKEGFGMLALGSPVQVMENYRYAELVRMISATRSAIPYSVPLHLFGAGHPHTMAMAVALGCDTFDSASYILFAREGRYMTERGAVRLKEMKYLPCSCPVCTRTTVHGLIELEPDELTRSLAIHNLHILKKELEGCKEAMVEGRLWDLVEEKAGAHPKLGEAFQEFAKSGRLMEAGTPPMKDKGLFVRGPLDGARPEVAIATRRLRDAVRRSSKTAVLIDSKEPLLVNRLGFKEEVLPPRGFDMYRTHPDFGFCPLELDFVYPFTQTVSSSGRTAGLVEGAKGGLRKMGYSRVLVGRVDSRGMISLARPTSRLRSRDAAPSPRPSSSRLRSPRRP